MRKVAFHTLGCKVNIYETEAMQRIMSDAGYTLVDFNDRADVYIINTCSVTNIADRKSRQILHKAKKENPDSIVVAAGCYVQSGAQKLKKDCNIDIIVGNNKKKDIALIINKYFDSIYNEPDLKTADFTDDGIELKTADFTNKITGVKTDTVSDKNNKKTEVLADKTIAGIKPVFSGINNDENVIDINKKCEYEDFGVSKLGKHTRSFIKVQDGCNQFCTYCIIPYTRGRIRSRSMQSIMAEVESLAKNGYKEMVLTGIHLSSYGVDIDKKEHLLELVSRVAGVEGVERVRVGSLEPRIISDVFVSGLKKIPQFCPHFHLSLQSGCDSVLRRMNRQYDSKDFINGVEIIRKYYKNPAITTDIIVGFPGESEEEFNISREFVDKIGFYEMHIFPFSIREGTKAANMPDQLTHKEKSSRALALSEINRKNSRDFRKKYIGQMNEILSEEIIEINQKRYISGHTREYLKVAVPYFEGGLNQFIKGEIKSFLNDDILFMQPLNQF